MNQVIYLQDGDDLPAICHLLEGATARRVMLVVPKGSDKLADTLSLRVLRRSSANLALDVALVTRDGRTRQMAAEEGIATVSSVPRGQRGRWRTRNPHRSPAQQAVLQEVEGLRSGRREVRYGDLASLWLGRIWAVLVFAALLCFVLLLAAIVVPQARITVVPYHQPVQASLTLRADPEVEKPTLEDLAIPARVLEIQLEGTEEAATVSTKDAPDAPATGAVTFVNQTASPLEILPGAVVRTSAGTTVRFVTVTTATLPPAIGATAAAEVEALEPGPVGNVAPATINVVETVALRGKVRVTNEQPTQGGGVKQVGVVTRADMDRLKAQLLHQLQQRAYLDLQNQLEPQAYLPSESLAVEILSEDYDQFLQAEADVLRLQMRIVASGTAFDGAHARLLAYEALKAKIPSTYGLESDEIAFDLAEEVVMEGRTARIEVTASAQLVADVDRGAVRSAVAGQSVDQAMQRLSEAFVLDAPPEVEIFPDWIKRWDRLANVPLLPFRIEVLVLE